MKSHNPQRGSKASIPMWQQLLAERGILEQAEKAGWEPGGNGWTYPVFDFEGNALKLPDGTPINRWKNFGSHLTPKYLWKPGKLGALCPKYYILPGTKQSIRSDGGRVYIASGEPDVLAYHVAGYPNVLSWFGEKSVPDTLREDLLHLGVREAIYYPDLDSSGLLSAQKVTRMLHGTQIDFRAYQLPAELGEKGDINRLWKSSGFDRILFQLSLKGLSKLSIEPIVATQSADQAVDAATIELRKAYAQRAFRDELAKLRATSTNRNDQLNASAYVLGQLAGAEVLVRAEIECALLDGAQAIGLSDREAVPTIKSGLDAGCLLPRDLSEIVAQKHDTSDDSQSASTRSKLTLLPPSTVVAADKYLPLSRKDLEALPHPAWLIPNLIQERTMVTLFGRSGCGKSFLALDIAIRAAQTSPVVYVAGEGLYGYLNRLNAWRKFNNRDEGNLHFVRNPIPMLDPVEITAFITAVMPLAPRLIVIDTLSRCIVGGDENSSKDMGLFVEACAEIQRATGATVLIIHHTGKNGIGERGSSVLRCACETMMELSKEESYVTLACNKMKDAPEFNTTTFHLRVVDLDGGESSCVLVPSERAVQTRRDPLTKNQRQLLEALSLEVFIESGAKTTALIQTAEVSGGSIYRVLSVLKRLGYVRQAQSGDPYFITPEGLAMLGKIPPEPQLSSPSLSHHDSINGSHS